MTKQERDQYEYGRTFESSAAETAYREQREALRLAASAAANTTYTTPQQQLAEFKDRIKRDAHTLEQKLIEARTLLIMNGFEVTIAKE
jgi:hypothetical protein